ncbi:DUF4190 domain-containing protein [Micromonospora halophytica]|uniref:DUF4190 domain-containing protein n=1 Tax=Micromonospora halophytica TaxID=47864 RepID=A0A1C5H409_9ACTN|nr:DUF4190 domain-containing protein [Micromonospora halophytica]SCG40762.1 protein of unknown function [Micromonospora halophytica]
MSHPPSGESEQPQWGQPEQRWGETQPEQPEQPPSPYEPPGGAGEQPRWGQQPPDQPWGRPEQPWGQPPPYPPQGPYGQYGPPQGGGGPNTLAILSLVLAFVFAPAGIVLGHLAKRQIKRTGEEGDQLATWGLVLSYAFTVIGLLACCGWIGFAIWAGSGDGTTY